MFSAHAASGFVNKLFIRCPDRSAAAGEADALRIIGNVFRRDIANGNRITFTDGGTIGQPA